MNAPNDDLRVERSSQLVGRKFKPGDRVRHANDQSTATILAVHDDHYWAQYDGKPWPPITAAVTMFDPLYDLISEPFLPNGEDRYCNVYPGGHVGQGHPTLAVAESGVIIDPRLGIIRIDGQTGALSWVKGGPTQNAEPFLPNGEDRYYNVYRGGHVGYGHPTIAAAESGAVIDPRLGVIRIDGQTGALSWAMGGPTQNGVVE